MHESLYHLEHRPWPMPKRPWTWRQSWCHLLFAHWQVSASQVRPWVPDPLVLEESQGQTWIGIVPFKMVDVTRRWCPPVPWVSAFPEINLRVYVTYQNKPGVWFLSLDATQPLAVWAAQRFFHLPYYRGQIHMNKRGETWHYESRGIKDRRGARFEGSYQPTSPVYYAKEGTLEHHLTERYCLYARSKRGKLFRTEVHHAPWPLQKAEVKLQKNSLTSPFGIHLPKEPTLLHYAERIDVITWPPELIS